MWAVDETSQCTKWCKNVVKASIDVVSIPALIHRMSNLLTPYGKVLLVDRQYKYGCP